MWGPAYSSVCGHGGRQAQRRASLGCSIAFGVGRETSHGGRDCSGRSGGSIG
jgi:hypothetical protein